MCPLVVSGFFDCFSVSFTLVHTCTMATSEKKVCERTSKSIQVDLCEGFCPFCLFGHSLYLTRYETCHVHLCYFTSLYSMSRQFYHEIQLCVCVKVNDVSSIQLLSLTANTHKCNDMHRNFV